MPLTGFILPDGKRVSLEEGIRHPEWFHLHPIVLTGIVRSLQHRGTAISATTLTGCLRRNYWERALPYEADPTKLLYAGFRGSVIHQVLENIHSEKVQAPGADGVRLEKAIQEIMSRFIPERRFYRRISVGDPLFKDGIEVSGQVDLLEVVGEDEKTGRMKVVIHDHKTSEAYPVLKSEEEGLKPEHIQQTNTYAWLVRAYGFEPVGIKLSFIGYNFAAVSGWPASIKRFSEIQTVQVPEVELWPEEKTLEVITPKALQMARAFAVSPKDDAGFLCGGLAPDDPSLPPADPGEGGWRCENCPFLDICPDGQAAMVAREAQKTQRGTKKARKSDPSLDDVLEEAGI